MGSGGGKGGGQSVKIYDYYGSIAATVCCGTVDELVAIIIDGDQVWELGDVLQENSPNPYVGTIAGRGTFKFYWGTEDQELAADSILHAENNTLQEQHPDYKGIAFIEFVDLLFGRERVSAPNVEVVVNRKPIQSLITDTPSELDDDQANLLCAAAELMTNNRFGLNLPLELFDAATFQTAAYGLWARRELCYGSPLLNTQDSLRSFMSNIGLMTDSFLRWDATGAKIEAGYWTHGETIDPETLPFITADDLTDPPDLDADSWTGMETGWAVTFNDRDRVYKESSEKYDDISLIEVTGEPNRATLKRPYITRRDQAIAHAVEWGKSRALPGLSGKISVRKTRAVNLRVGSLFRLDVDAEPGGTQLAQICRIIEMSYPKTGSVEIKLEAETNLVPLAHTPPVTGGNPGQTIEEPVELIYVRPVELPPKLSNTDYGVAVLTQRQDSMTIGYSLLYDDSADGDFPMIGNQRTFAVRCSLDSALSDTAKGSDEVGYDSEIDAPVLDTSTAFDIDLLNLADDLGMTSARNDQLLLLLIEIEDSGDRTGQVKLDANGFPMLEILSLSAMTAPEAGKRQIEALRGRFGTMKRSFSAGSEAWLIYKDSIKVFAHKDFPTAASNQTTCYFKTQPYNVFISRDISGDGTTEFLFPTDRLFAPQINMTATPSSGYVGVAVTVEGSISDQDGDLTFWSVSYRKVGAGVQDEVSVAGGPIEATNQYDFKVPIRFVESGTYDVIIRAKDNTTFTDSFIETSFQTAISAVGDSNPPAASTGLTATTGFLMIWLEWINPEDSDLDYIEVWGSDTNDLATAAKLADTGASFFAHNVSTADDHYYWIRAVDTSGNVGPYNAGQYSGTHGTANVLITGDNVGQNEIIAYAANIANGIITNAKIANLSVDKLTGGTIGAIQMILAANGIFKSANYVQGESGFMLNGNGNAELYNALIRSGTIIGGVSKSQNYEEGVSGAKINWDTGAAEFWNVNIYGTVPAPQVFLGTTELASGSDYTHESGESPLTLTISTAAGTTAYYRTDGLVPSGLPSEIVPTNNQISISANSQLRVVAFEDSTSRSSSTFSAGFSFVTFTVEFSQGAGGWYFRIPNQPVFGSLKYRRRWGLTGWPRLNSQYWLDWSSTYTIGSGGWISLGNPAYYSPSDPECDEVLIIVSALPSLTPTVDGLCYKTNGGTSKYTSSEINAYKTTE